MKPAPPGAVPQGTALVHYPASQQNSPQIPASTGRFDEPDLSSEQSPPKNAEAFVPKGSLRSGGGGVFPISRTKAQGEGALSSLSEQMGSMGLEESESNASEAARDHGYFPPVAAAGDAGVGAAAHEPAVASS